MNQFAFSPSETDREYAPDSNWTWFNLYQLDIFDRKDKHNEYIVIRGSTKK
jgi:hypothetical protein